MPYLWHWQVYAGCLFLETECTYAPLCVLNLATMKKNYTLLTSLYIIFLLHFCGQLHAQYPASEGESLNGETVVDLAGIKGGTIVATGNSIYAAEYSGDGALGIAHGYLYEKLWSPPPPRRIVKIGNKKVLKRDNEGKVYDAEDSDDEIVLLDNGDVYKLHINHADLYNRLYFPELTAESYFGAAAGGGSEGYDKVLGDALYVLSSSHLYISLDSAVWKVDSAGLGNAHVYDVALNVKQEVYVATDKGLFMQDTATHAFEKINTYAGPQNIYSIFIDRKKRIFLGINGGGIYVSTDSGTVWHADTAGAGNSQPQRFTDDSVGNVYFATNSHIYRSLGGTQSWRLADSSIYNIIGAAPVITSLTTFDSIVIAGTSTGQFLSINSGRSWVTDNDGIRPEHIYGVAKASGHLLLSTSLGIFKTGVNDTTWNKKYPLAGLLGNLPLYSDGNGAIYTINNSVAVSNKLGLVLKSVNGGETWLPDTTGLSGVGGSVFFVDETGALHIGNSFYGSSFKNAAWAKAKSGSWAIDTTGLPTENYSFVTTFTSDAKGHLYVTGYFSGQRVMRRPIAGGAWVVDTAGIPAAVSYFDKMVGAAGDVVGTTGSAIYHRGSGTWSVIPLPAGISFPSVRAISIDTSGYIYAALYGSNKSGVYFTGNLGITWHHAGLDSANITSLVSIGDTTYVLTADRGAFLLTHNSILPVALSLVKAYQIGKGIQVQWRGYNEINMRGYDVERSTNGASFNKIGTQAAKGGATENNYNLLDAAPLPGDNFYRIKAIGKDGTAQYSGIVKVSINTNSDMVVYPNPVGNKVINVQLDNVEAGNYSLIVYSVAGQKLYTRVFTHSGGTAGIGINMQGMAKGAYWLVLKGDKHTYRKTIVVQ